MMAATTLKHDELRDTAKAYIARPSMVGEPTDLPTVNLPLRWEDSRRGGH